MCHDARHRTTCRYPTTIFWNTRTAAALLAKSSPARDAFPWEYGDWTTYPPRDVLLDPGPTLIPFF